MSDLNLIFSSAAAIQLRKLSKEQRSTVIDKISGQLSNLKKNSRDIVSIKGTDYVAVPSDDFVAVLRPMTREESSKYIVPGKERSFLVAELANSVDDVVKRARKPGRGLSTPGGAG